ncbi:MAG: hypothetical protein ABIO44_14525 [Saprospiraceae bacterium]
MSLPFLTFSQVKIKDILNNSLLDIKVQNSILLKNEVKSLVFNSPWIKSVEGRVGITGSTLGDTIYGYLRNEDNYDLILRMNSFRMIKREKRVKKALEANLNTEAEWILESTLLERYELIIDYNFFGQEINQFNLQDNILKKRQELVREKVEMGLDFKVKELLQIEENRSKLSKDLFQLKQQFLECKSKLENLRVIDSIQFIDTFQFVTIEKIQNTLNNLDIVPEDNFEFQLKKSDMEIALAKLDYTNSQNTEIFDGIRFSYDNPLYLTLPKKFNTINNFSIRAGFKIPISGNNNYRRSQAEIQLKEKELSMQYVLEKNKFANHDLRVKIYSLIEFYNRCKRLETQSLYHSLMSNPISKQKLEPLDWYDLQWTYEENKFQYLSLSRDITKLYIQLLYTCGRLGKSPHINYLSELGEVW